MPQMESWGRIAAHVIFYHPRARNGQRPPYAVLMYDFCAYAISVHCGHSFYAAAAFDEAVFWLSDTKAQAAFQHLLKAVPLQR